MSSRNQRPFVVSEDTEDAEFAERGITRTLRLYFALRLYFCAKDTVRLSDDLAIHLQSTRHDGICYPLISFE